MNGRFSRRSFAKCSAAWLLAQGVWPGALAAKTRQSGSFQFIAVNDLHYFNQKCQTWFESVKRSMLGQPGGMEFVLISGDLVENGAREQLGAMNDWLSSLKLPYYVVVGNHDYQTQTNRQAFESLFPRRLNYRFEHQGWQLVGLDTTEGQKSQNVLAPAETLQWLDAELPKVDKQKPTLLFTHFPLAFGVPFILRNANAILDRFRDINLQAVYSGHYHGFTEKLNRGITLTTNKCCSFHRANHDKTPEKGYFLCRAENGRIERKFIQVN